MKLPPPPVFVVLNISSGDIPLSAEDAISALEQLHRAFQSARAPGASAWVTLHRLFEGCGDA